MKRFLVLMLLSAAAFRLNAAYCQPRSTVSLNLGWRFSLGDASSMEKDFTHGTEYFTYLSKAAATGQNRGPAWNDFDDSGWQEVTLPHDWVVDLPYSGEASHSHGYKQVGWKYPQNSVGWYRRHLFVPKEDEGRHVEIRFDGIFRHSQVFCNGFYLGEEPSGYATRSYNLTEYLNYGGDNVITVRADASVEEGWYYEGAGIYRDVWLVTTQSKDCHIVSVSTRQQFNDDGSVTIVPQCRLSTPLPSQYAVRHTLGTDGRLTVSNPKLWSAETPYLYTMTTTLVDGEGNAVDEVRTKLGLRDIRFTPEEGMTVNGTPVKLKGTNLHLDHAGVGTGVPDSLWLYRVKKMKELGSNAIRCSHNPATPAMLDICDSLGMYVIDENRLMGTNGEHYRLLKNMIERDQNHPSVILWSIGNEEWAIESSEAGVRIAETMKAWAHRLDPTRLTTYGNSGGNTLVEVPDVHGYNYIVQNSVRERRERHPDWVVIGTEETSGCGTRNVYATDSIQGWMEAINYEGEERSEGEKNVIERGWKFYRDNAWAAGLFYWTGFDYRGEPNPMKWPATGSQFGILDYCGFPKDEAYYLKAAWTEEPVLHLLPHWNLKGHENLPVEVWAYSNCDEVELLQDGKSLGRKTLEKDSHLSWATTYKPGKLEARGYRNGRRVVTEKVETTSEPMQVKAEMSKQSLRRDGQDIAIVDLSLLDKKGRLVPDACDELQVSVEGSADIIGWGNGNPGFKSTERPSDNAQGAEYQVQCFMGHAQLILRSKAQDGAITLSISGVGSPATISF